VFTGGSSPGIERSELEAATPSSSTEFKNEWNYTCTPSIRLRDVDRDYLSFKQQLLERVGVLGYDAVVSDVSEELAIHIFQGIFNRTKVLFDPQHVMTNGKG
jgi:hypothetical protein